MSLHLIESRPVPVLARVRNPGGALTSMIIHAGFAAAVLTLATSPMMPSLDKPEISHVSYVAPPPLPAAPPMRCPGTCVASPNPLQPAVLAAMPDIPTIEIAPTIPDISLVPTSISTDLTPTHSLRRSGTGPDGLPGGSNTNGSSILTGEQVDKPVMLMPGTPLPKYPELLRTAGIQDTVLATFVVDTLGRVEMNTLQAQGGAHALFVSSVRESLFQARFKPAERGGQRVRQLVVQPFVFTLNR